MSTMEYEQASSSTQKGVVAFPACVRVIIVFTANFVNWMRLLSINTPSTIQVAFVHWLGSMLLSFPGIIVLFCWQWSTEKYCALAVRYHYICSLFILYACIIVLDAPSPSIMFMISIGEFFLLF